MSRFTFLVVAFIAMLCFVSAQNFSSSSVEVIIVSSSTGSTSSSEIPTTSSTGLVNPDSSSSSIGEVLVSSSTGLVDNSSSTGLVDNSSSTGLVDNSSSTGLIVDSSSSSSSSSWVNPLPYVPENWGDLAVSDNNTLFRVTWGPKSNENLMKNVGSADGFIVDGESGRPIRLHNGNTYTVSIEDATTAAEGFYISWDAAGGSATGSNVSVPLTTVGNHTFIINVPNDDQPHFLYYASSRNQFAGGALIVGTQSAAALQASFLVMAISAFVALLFPKW